MSFDTNQYNNAYNLGNQLDDQPKGSSGLAITSMVLGILSLVCCFVYCGSIPLAIVSIILGIIVLAKKKKGKSFAIAGIVTSAIGILMSIAILILCKPYIQGMEAFVANQDQYVQQYQQSGQVPDIILDMFGGNEDMAKQFMDGYVSGYTNTEE